MASADAYVLKLIREHPNTLVPQFIIHSWLYYVADDPLIGDATFDTIVEELGRRWEEVDHPHKGLIQREILKSGFYLQYPGIVPGAALSLWKTLNPGQTPPESILSRQWKPRPQSGSTDAQ